MKRIHSLTLVGVMALVPVTRAVDRIVTTEAATGPGSLTAAINALNDGDRITFNIPPAAGEVHYIQTPPDGYPLITKNNITIDGYTQAGASPNTASIHATNDAVLKIVLTSTNGNALSMETACDNSWGAPLGSVDWGYGDSEQAILGFFHATNATVRGLVIQSAPLTATSITAGDCKSICFAAVPLELGGWRCQNWHVSGCWFGVDPVTRQVAYMPDGTTVASPAICIASYRSRNVVGGSEPTWNYNWPGTIGVAAGSATPRAEFNVFVTGYGFDSEGHDFRVSGNFFNVLPDGVTAADMSVLNGGAQLGDGYVEIGRNTSNVTFGTDGDGVNDADEGNVCGPIASGGAVCLDLYSPNGQGKNRVIAGNYFNADINGNTFGANLGGILNAAQNTATVRFGSDFNGVSDALEGNLAINELLFFYDNTWPTRQAWVSMRGNSLSNCIANSATGRPPLGDGSAPAEGQNTYAQFIDITGAGGATDIIPVVGAGTTTTTLTGTCGKRSAPYIRVVLDLYEADTTSGVPPQGKKWLGRFMENSAADSNPAEGAFTFNITSLGIASGTQVTIAATYIIDVTITSISHSGGSTTLTISGGTPPYDILGATTVDGLYTLVTTTASTTATFAAPADMSFYRVVYHPQITSGSGQTSPFSNLFTIP